MIFLFIRIEKPLCDGVYTGFDEKKEFNVDFSHKCLMKALNALGL